MVIGGKHFGQYTYEHWFDDDFEEEETKENDDSSVIKTNDNKGEE